MLKYKKIILFTIIFMCLFVCSLSTISAANNTINTSSTITNGIAGTGAGDTLTLQEGIYNKTGDYGITISKNITIQGNTSTNQVIIDAQGLNRIFTINNNLNVTFINITFTNGRAGNGGAIYNQNTATKMTFINCTFTNNVAPSGEGGAINNFGANMRVNGCTFINNTVVAGGGGAIWNQAGGNLSVSDSTFINNTANYAYNWRGGGAIYNMRSHVFSVIGCTFINNTADPGTGSALANRDSNNVIVSGCTFINNAANVTNLDRGGIIFILASSNITINYNRIFNNTDVNGFDIVNNQGSNVNADFNWWGTNNITNISGRISGTVAINNYYIFNFTNSSSLDNLHVGD
ncbi:right-handed parallel beta-helix repeat-containing protein, partial [Methanobrevibacter cuticularis]|uniref:right-handed parallel beta-helix repeat-containing protein n=1 Tax=Methanobrevibacter cuticularis TaxID=47311 RepID=UPI000B0869A7